MPIYSIAHYTTARESTSTNGLKHLVLYLKSIIAAGEMEASDLYKTFLDLLLQAQQKDAFITRKRLKDIVETNLTRVTKKLWQQD